MGTVSRRVMIRDMDMVKARARTRTRAKTKDKGRDRDRAGVGILLRRVYRLPSDHLTGGEAPCRLRPRGISGEVRFGPFHEGDHDKRLGGSSRRIG